MYDFIDVLKSKKIINREDIISLKEDINKNYPNLNERDRVNLLAKSIHTMLNEKLNHFSEKAKNEIKTEIIKNNLAKNKVDLYGHDIFEICLTIQEKDEKILDEISKWINKNLDIDVDTEEISDYILSLNNADEKNTEREVIIKSLQDNKNQMEFSKKFLIVAISIILVILPLISNIHMTLRNKQLETTSTTEIKLEAKFEASKSAYMEYMHLDSSHIPYPLRYRDINGENLKNYLASRNSTLSKEPYFSAIINSAKKFNLNPLILFSIAGHEQAFVPMDHKFAKEIANNPFNVFRSWKEYNTDIVDSSSIAARTVFNLLKDRPEDENPFKWINRKYAQDPNWYKGVEMIYKTLEKEIH